MRFSTDDGRFGFIIAPSDYRKFFRFQLVVDGDVIGDEEDCILGTAIMSLGDLNQLDDGRLADVGTDAMKVLPLLQTDELLHDAATLSIAESLDHWATYGFKYKENVVILAHPYREDGSIPSVSVSVVPSDSYDSIIDAVRTYWNKYQQ